MYMKTGFSKKEASLYIGGGNVNLEDMIGTRHNSALLRLVTKFLSHISTITGSAN